MKNVLIMHFNKIGKFGKNLRGVIVQTNNKSTFL